jgi:phosphohistidine phosphatase
MELLLWRHAEAADTAPDMLRELTTKGLQQAEIMGKWLRPRLPKGSLILVSPASRTQQTAEALKLDFITRRDIGPGADAKAILKAAGWPDADGTVVIVGHQPSLGEAASMALTGKAQYLSVKKGSVWWISSRISEGVTQANLRAVIPPNLIKVPK